MTARRRQAAGSAAALVARRRAAALRCDENILDPMADASRRRTATRRASFYADGLSMQRRRPRGRCRASGSP